MASEITNRPRGPVLAELYSNTKAGGGGLWRTLPIASSQRRPHCLSLTGSSTKGVAYAVAEKQARDPQEFEGPVASGTGSAFREA